MQKLRSCITGWSAHSILSASITHQNDPQLHKTSFLTLCAMAMDNLPIQASSVACERVFSSSSETDVKKRIHINSLLMEALQMLKFLLKRDQLNVNEWFLNISEKDMIPDNLTPDYMTGQPITPGLLTELADAVGVEIRANSLFFYEYFSYNFLYFPFIFDYWPRSHAILFGFILLLWSHLLTWSWDVCWSFTHPPLIQTNTHLVYII